MQPNHDLHAIEDAAAALAAALGTQRVSATCAATLRALLPESAFLRASVRCGKGLFVSQDLLQPGDQELSVVSLKNSLAGVALVHRQPIVVSAPAGPADPAASGPPTSTHVLCMPVAVHKQQQQGTVAAEASRAAAAQGMHAAAGPEGGAAAPLRTPGAVAAADAAATTPSALFVGALMVGSRGGSGTGLPPTLWQQLQQLAEAAAPYLLVLSLTKGSEMADLLRLRAADCSCCCEGEEDELQDVPLEACTHPLPPGGGAGGTAGALAAAPAPGSSSSGSGVLQEQLDAAAQAALAGASSLPAVPELGNGSAAAAAAAAEADCAGSSRSGKCALGKGQQQRQRRRPGVPSSSAGAAAGAAGGQAPAEEAEEEEDPKAAVKRQAARAAPAAAPAATAPPPADTLLCYADPALEAQFAAAQNRSMARADVLFASMHLAAGLCLALLNAGTVLTNVAVQVFLAMLAAPLLGITLWPARYCRHRETLLAALCLAHAVLLRYSSLPALLRLLPPGALRKLPWLLRATGAEALAIFPVGFKMRFHVFLPVQGLCLALVMSALPLPCQALLASATGCLPAPMLKPGIAVLLSLGGLLPAAALYRFEISARQRFYRTWVGTSSPGTTAAIRA